MFQAYKNEHLRLLRVHRVVDGVCNCSKRVCSTPGKHPAPWDGKPNNGVHNASKVWTEEHFEECNVGIATGKGLLVVDIDPRHNGHITWRELVGENALPDTWVCATGGGGTHIYFKVPNGKSIRSLSYHGVDFQYDGKYVIAPPSRHASGAAYEWEDCDPEEDEIAECPEWLLNWLEAHDTRLRAATVPEGTTQNITPADYEWPWIHHILENLTPDIDYSNWLAIGMGLHATGSSEAFELWDEWSSKGKKYRPGETQIKWKSFSAVRGVGEGHTYRWLYAMAEMYNIEYGDDDDFLKDWQSNPVEVRLDTTENYSIEELVEGSTPLIKDLYENALDNAHVRIPEFAFASALQVLSGAAQGSYMDAYGGSLNLYQWCAAQAGAGKDSYFKWTEKRLSEIRENLLSPEFTTVGGLRLCLLAFNSRVSVKDEFHDVYQELTHTKNEYTKAVLKDYKMLWNVPNTLPPTVIKTSLTPPANEPVLGLMGWSTVVGLEACASQEFLTSGLGSRFLFWPVSELLERTTPKPTPLSKKTIAALKKIFNLGLTIQGKATDSDEVEISKMQKIMAKGEQPEQINSVARQKRIGIDGVAYQKIVSDSWPDLQKFHERRMHHHASLYSRKAQQALRVATLRCISDNRSKVEQEDLTWGLKIAERTIATALSMFVEAEHVTTADEASMARVSKVLATLETMVMSTQESVLKRDLSNNLRISAKNIDEALLHLIAADKVKCVDRMGRQIYPQRLERGYRFLPSE